jgi:phosphoadenosine phosphosulfate reductase
MTYTFDLPQVNIDFEAATAEEIIEWAAGTFSNRIVVSSSFQTQSVALLHIISRVAPQVPVIFVDTGYHFAETLAYRDQLADMMNLNIVTVSAEPVLRQDLDGEGNPLYQSNPDLCCALHKTAALRKGLVDTDAWITGIRRDQTQTRKLAHPVEQQKDGLFKVNPLLNWTSRDLWTYINRNELPSHPLFSEGYASIGCWPCTRAIHEGEDERSGRWAGRQKVECGLHTTDIRATV